MQAFLPSTAITISRTGHLNRLRCPSQKHRHLITKQEQQNANRTPQSALGFGFLKPKREKDKALPGSSPLPSPDTQCPCASFKTYGQCCRRFHVSQRTPPQAEDLLRSRYSAYAYRLPSYIMKTTDSSAIELDKRMWKKEILTFCAEYQFVGGVDVLQVEMPAPSTTRILFQANMMQQNAPLSFMEMATFVCKDNIWYYKSGKLVVVNNP